MTILFHRHVPACSHSDTFKYFVDERYPSNVFEACGDQYGSWRIHGTGPLPELCSERLLLRTAEAESPVTVFRTSGFSVQDAKRLHEVMNFHLHPDEVSESE